MLLLAQAFSQIEYLTKLVEINNCYGPDTSVHFTEANKSICIKLEITNNNRCSVFQDGINITFNMLFPSNNTGGGSSTPTQQIYYGFHYGFEYNTTKFICIDVVQATTNPPATPSFQQAGTVQITFNSIGYQTIFIAGLVQKITNDNNQALKDSNSTLFFDEKDICYNVIVDPNFLPSFDKNNIVNFSLDITDYYASGQTKSNLTYNLDNNTNNNNTTNITYTQSSNSLQFCFKNVSGLQKYVYLDFTYTNSYIQMYYKFSQTSQGMTDIIEVYKGQTSIYQFTSEQNVYREINCIVMPDKVAMQFILSTTQQNLTKIKEYNTKVRETYPNHTAMKIVYISCLENPDNAGAAYTNISINFVNSSQVFKYDFYRPNASLDQAITRFWGFVSTEEGCTPQFTYQIFGFNNGSNIFFVYKQNGTNAHFSCFNSVKYSNTGRLEFLRNDLNCSRLNKSQDVIFIILNQETRKIEAQYPIQNFTIENLKYSIPLNVTIDPDTMSLQIVQRLTRTMIDQVTLVAVTEAPVTVSQEKSIPIVIFAAVQFVCMSLQVAFRKIVVPKLSQQLAQKRLMRQKLTNVMDL